MVAINGKWVMAVTRIHTIGAMGSSLQPKPNHYKLNDVRHGNKVAIHINTVVLKVHDICDNMNHWFCRKELKIGRYIKKIMHVQYTGFM